MVFLSEEVAYIALCLLGGLTNHSVSYVRRLFQQRAALTGLTSGIAGTIGGFYVTVPVLFSKKRESKVASKGFLNSHIPASQAINGSVRKICARMDYGAAINAKISYARIP